MEIAVCVAAVMAIGGSVVWMVRSRRRRSS